MYKAVQLEDHCCFTAILTPLKMRAVPDFRGSPLSVPLSAPYTSGQTSAFRFSLKSSFRMDGKATRGTQWGPPKPLSQLSERKTSVTAGSLRIMRGIWSYQELKQLVSTLTHSVRCHTVHDRSTSTGSRVSAAHCPAPSHQLQERSEAGSSGTVFCVNYRIGNNIQTYRVLQLWCQKAVIFLWGFIMGFVLFMRKTTVDERAQRAATSNTKHMQIESTSKSRKHHQFDSRGLFHKTSLPNKPGLFQLVWLIVSWFGSK